MSADTLGDRMKEYERAYSSAKLLPGAPALARIDGRAFSTFTRDLRRPYDERLSALMVEVAELLAEETAARAGYTQSDEISLLWHAENPLSEIFFAGRVQKMESVLAGLATCLFCLRLPAHLPPGHLERLPHFDARVWSVPSREEAANYFLWRERDATKNSVQMAAQQYYSHKQLQNKHGGEQQEMLFAKGVNWNDYPAFFKRGSFVRRVVTARKFTAQEMERLPPLHAARGNPDLAVQRADYVRVDMPPFGKVANRAAVLFDGAEPIPFGDLLPCVTRSSTP